MKDEYIDFEEQIRRCRRLRESLTDDEMRDALEQLAEYYEARLKRQNGNGSKGFMLRNRD
jgi:hypothetical protein